MTRRPEHRSAPALRWLARPAGPGPIVVLYPAGFAALASALGLQAIYHALAAHPLVDLAWIEAGRVRTLSGQTISRAAVLCVSIAYELELLELLPALRAAGIEPLAARRAGHDPRLIVGGALAHVNPGLLAGLADLVVVGAGEELVSGLVGAALEGRAALASEAARLRDAVRLAAPPVAAGGPAQILRASARADRFGRPAVSAWVAPGDAFGGMFLIELQRGCPYRCAFCSVGHWDAPAHFFPAEQVLALVPPGEPRVGLVGAAVSDHPACEDVLAALVGRGCLVSLASLRASRVSARLARLLAAGGARSLTIAADGASERLRAALDKRVSEEQLVAAAAHAAAAGLRGVKLYAMIGLPDERDEDLAELRRLTARLAALRPAPQVSLAVSPFVPKPGTPLAGAAFVGVAEAGRRLRLLRELPPGVTLVANSPRLAALEHALAHGGPALLEALVAQLDRRRTLRPDAALVRSLTAAGARRDATIGADP